MGPHLRLFAGSDEDRDGDDIPTPAPTIRIRLRDLLPLVVGDAQHGVSRDDPCYTDRNQQA